MGYDLEEDAIYEIEDGSSNEMMEKMKSKKITKYLKPINKVNIQYGRHCQFSYRKYRHTTIH